MVLQKINKKIRCEVRGCRNIAVAGLGYKGYDYLICSEHLAELKRDVEAIFNETKHTEEVKIAEKPEDSSVKPEAVNTKQNEPEASADEYYVCKWCGEKFSKKEMASAEYLKHCRVCKAEHGGVLYVK